MSLCDWALMKNTREGVENKRNRGLIERDPSGRRVF